ncbi:MAG: choice-of-anchor D domain-containing protein [Deltaproteobacteria bacterium]|nr:choice-of-anchor D domain-containing protein [Deltaproteobacteria bacterium]MCB9786339.1 choice-of-anchor D domain-containing protein [Deltaproteobacteria bacterium]
MGGRRWLAALACVVASGCGDSGEAGGFTAGSDTQLAFVPELVDFPAVVLGDRLTRTIDVWHGGRAGTLRLRRARLETESGDLALEGPESVDLAPGEHQIWTLTYAPLSREPDTGTVVIEHNLASGGPIRIPVTTPGQEGRLTADPPLVDFGTLAPGENARRTVTLRNIGSESVAVQSIDLDGAGQGDFALEIPSSTLGTLAVGGSALFDVTYTPHGWNADKATLTIHATGAIPEITLGVVGQERGPVIAAVPTAISFGPVGIGDSRTESLTLTNRGSGELIITEVKTSAGAEGLSVVPQSPLPATLGPNDFLFVDVTHAPLSAQPGNGPLGDVEVVSNDLSHQPLVVPVSGTAGSPTLRVEPSDVVAFGFVAQKVTAYRDVTLANIGELPLEVSAVDISGPQADEMLVVPVPGFSPTQATPKPALLLPGESRTFQVAFTNQGGPKGKVFATLAVRSDDPERPEHLVDIVAERAGEPTCLPTFSPLFAAFGGVSHHSSKTLTVQLRNTGTGNCTLQGASIDHCDTVGVFQTCAVGTPSAEFSPVAALGAGANLGPGDSIPIDIRFDAPGPSQEDGSTVDWFYGRLEARLLDPQTGAAVTVPPSFPGLVPAPNLSAASGKPRLTVYPDDIDFGFVATGCSTPPTLISLFSVGAVPVEISAVASGPCLGDFHLDSALAPPFSLEVGSTLGLEPRFTATDLGVRTCTRSIHSTDPADPVHAVRLRAEGVASTHVSETFEGKSTSVVDVLFVVDDSGSMGEEQQNLAANLGVFIQAANAWEADYRIGVTTTDASLEGALQGSPEVVTPQTSDSFLDNVLVGTSGSGFEQGLETARLSLEGPFKKYLRQDATLVAVFVSDEEDQSPDEALSYLNLFQSIKGGTPGAFTAYAIVGPPDGCDSLGGSADPGIRYIKVAEQSGGKFASICAPDFSESLADFGEGAFGPKSTFLLGGVAQPGTVAITVDGSPCTEGWKLSDSGRAVVFDPDAACLPDEGVDVLVEYELFCF